MCLLFIYYVESVFIRFISEDIWQDLVTATNIEFAKRRSASTSPKRNINRDTTVEELKKFYGLNMLMENTYANNTKDIRKHFAKIKSDYGRVPKIGVDRFQSILHCLAPSPVALREICCKLHRNFADNIENVTLVTGDEALMQYHNLLFTIIIIY